MADKPFELDALRAQLAHLRRAYHLELTSKRRELELHYAHARAQGWSLPALAPLLLTLHKLAGSAGTFGFEQLSILAHRAEEQVRRLQALPTPPELADLEALQRALESLLEGWPEPS